MKDLTVLRPAKAFVAHTTGNSYCQGVTTLTQAGAGLLLSTQFNSMNMFFLPTSGFAYFQVQARKRGDVRCAWGCFVCVHITERGLWWLSRKQGCWWYSGQNETPSGQLVRKVSKSALELGKKNHFNSLSSGTGFASGSY